MWHHLRKQLVLNWLTTVLVHHRAQCFLYQKRQIDVHGTYGFAGLAVETIFDDGPVVFLAVVKQGQDKPDGTNIDMTILMAAHFGVDRADVGTGTTPDTAQSLCKNPVNG